MAATTGSLRSRKDGRMETWASCKSELLKMKRYRNEMSATGRVRETGTW